MIKYAKINNFNNCGELGIFSHVYMFREKQETPSIILINGYTENNTVFKGKIFDKTSEFTNEKLSDHETKVIEKYVGKFKTVNLFQFSENSNFEKERFSKYKLREVNK